jgi:hypothetical protein
MRYGHEEPGLCGRNVARLRENVQRLRPFSMAAGNLPI